MRAHRLIIEACTTHCQRSAWGKDAALLGLVGAIRVQNTHRLAVDVAHYSCLNVTRGSATIASISFVIIVLLVFEL